MQENTSIEVASRLEGFAEFVHKVMQDWKVPGVAISIVKDGDVIYSQGFGKRDVTGDQDVTPQTLFAIASCTKAFTTASMALLVDEGKLDWDTPVRQYLPDFSLYDTVAAERITPRDLVTHRTGLPRHDLAWYHSSATRHELFERLRYLEPTKDFRTLWQYQNLMYMVAGYLVGQVVGQEWEAFVQKRLFQPLGMERSNFSIVETVKHSSDFSHPYNARNDEVKEIPFYGAQDAIAPAGAIVSCVEDMSKWLLMHLNKGQYHGSQIISFAQIEQLHTPHMVLPEISKYVEIPYSSYALGWMVAPYRGHPMLYHSGGIDGFSSLTSLFPQEHIGIVVLTNMDGSPVPHILTYNAFECLLGLREVPWSERWKQEQNELEAARQQGKAKSETDRVANTHPSHELTSYTGDYQHPGYGIITVDLQDNQLQATFNSMKGPLLHYHYDIFEMALAELNDSFKVSFLTNIRGDVDTLIAPLQLTASDIVFRRVPNKQMREKSFLEQFVGVYEFMHMDVVVSLKHDALQVVLPREPEYVLEPYEGNKFHVKNMSGLSFEFQRDASGAVSSVLLVRPDGAFTAHKK
jgi:CubicO group peptidase (beta-lactamase class C family)